MTTSKQFKAELTTYVDRIKQTLATGISVETLEKAKQVQEELSARKDLFTFDTFSLPNRETVYRTILIHQDDAGEFALYVNASWPGQQSAPHDHGGSWAIVTAVEGHEMHSTYFTNESSQSDAPLITKGHEIEVKPGQSIALMPDGIHSIRAETADPLLHLHLYAVAYEFQGQRREYDLEQNTYRQFVLEDVGFVEDWR